MLALVVEVPLSVSRLGWVSQSGALSRAAGQDHRLSQNCESKLLSSLFQIINNNKRFIISLLEETLEFRLGATNPAITRHSTENRMQTNLQVCKSHHTSSNYCSVCIRPYPYARTRMGDEMKCQSDRSPLLVWSAFQCTERICSSGSRKVKGLNTQVARSRYCSRIMRMPSASFRSTSVCPAAITKMNRSCSWIENSKYRTERIYTSGLNW